VTASGPATPPVSPLTRASALADVLAVLAESAPRLETLAAAVDTAAAALGATAAAIASGAGPNATALVHRGAGPAAPLLAVRPGDDRTVTLPPVCAVEVVPLSRLGAERFIVARPTPFDDDERRLLAAIAHALGLASRLRTAWDTERSLVERSRLLERLTRIQRSISHGAPLQDVLDAVTAGAAELVGTPIAGIRLIDPDNPDQVILRSAYGIRPELLETVRRSPVGTGAGGRAIAENRLVVVTDYTNAERMLDALAADQVQVAMAAPIHEHGKAVGSLAVASYQPQRRFTESEREALLALAEHASLAVTDAKTVAALREAQEAQELFLAMVSHELKTPLTAILGTLRTVQRHHAALPPERLDAMLAAAHERGRELSALIDRLLEGARAELSTAPREVRLGDLVADALRGFEHVVAVPDTSALDQRLRVDAAAVRGVVGTLLENAVAHSDDERRIRVDVGVDDDEVAIAVRNPGQLPASMEVDDLFRPFRRGPDARSSGVGLGLHIAARLAASLRGRIDVDSSEAGTVAFVLRFPVERADEALRGADAAGAEPDLHRRTG